MPGTFIVTGAAGFIGARVVEALHREGSTIISVDERAAFTSRPEQRGLDFGTIVGVDELAGFLAQSAPKDLQAIIHLGACTDTLEMDEALLARRNLDYTRSLWTFAAQRGVTLAYASSAATYGGGEHGYDDDESRLGELVPLNPYGWSKHRFDLWALEREKEGTHPPTWAGLKFFNVYGFGERHKARMASMILHGFDQIRRDGKVRLFKSHRPGIADGEQKRDFIYVDDVVSIVLYAAKGGMKRGIYNVGTGRARTFADLATATFRALGLEPNIEYIDMPEDLRGRYQYFTQAEVARLRAAGWTRPFESLEDGVAAYVKRLLAHESA